jgi:hypothetical protein
MNISYSGAISDDYEAMYDDLLRHLNDASKLVKEVKINKQNCFRLDGKFANLIITIQGLKVDNEPLSPAIYHKFVSILIDLHSFLKKCSVKTFLSSLNKNKMRNKFDQLSQKLTEIMMEEPRLLPRDRSFSGGSGPIGVGGSSSVGGNGNGGGYKIRSAGLLLPSSLSFDDSNLPKPKQEELLYNWILEHTSLSRDQAQRYAVLLVRRSIHSEARLGRKIARESDYLHSIGIASHDAKLIVDALKSSGYLTLPTPTSQRRVSSSSSFPLTGTSIAPSDASTDKRKDSTKPRMTPSNSLKHLNTSDLLNIPELTPLTLATTLHAMAQSEASNNESLAYSALVGVSELVEGSEEYQFKYGVEGGCSSVISLLHSMCQIENICEVALKAICLLCRYGVNRSTTSSENIAQFGLCDGCQLIINVAKAFPGPVPLSPTSSL